MEDAVRTALKGTVLQLQRLVNQAFRPVKPPFRGDNPVGLTPPNQSPNRSISQSQSTK